MDNRHTNYRLTLRYGLISFFAIAIAAVCIFLFFRYQTVQVIEDSSRRSNEVLAVATEHALNDHFVMYLNFVGQDSEIANKNVALGPALSTAFQKLLLNTSVVRMKIYNAEGTVVYSTKPSQVGEGQEDNDGFRKALKGEISSVLIYRDTFNLFDKEKEDENLVQTYVPIRLVSSGDVKGVFEVYSDVNDYIHLSDRSILLVSIIVILCMVILYAFLLLNIKRSEHIINKQNKQTQERNRMLEYLTAKMISAQEDERRRIAHELHEDVVQTISGVKMQLERYMNSLTYQEPDSTNAEMTQSIVPVLQEAAQKIRMVAMDLRPPSLDDFGLRAAMNSLMSECHSSTSDVEVTLNFRVSEADLSADKKSILYRMLKDALTKLCFKSELKGDATVTLEKADSRLVLSIKVSGVNELDRGYEAMPEFLEDVQERTILSGGKFDFEHASNTVESVSSWAV